MTIAPEVSEVKYFTNVPFNFFRCEFKESLDVIKNFCALNLDMKVGNNGFSGAELLSALTSTTSSTNMTADELTHSETSTPFVPLRTYDFSEFKCDKNDVKSLNYPDKEMYSKDDLDFLALAFAAVKISYLRGNFNILTTIVT